MHWASIDKGFTFCICDWHIFRGKGGPRTRHMEVAFARLQGVSSLICQIEARTSLSEISESALYKVCYFKGSVLFYVHK
jgi:hypothetical protein